MSLLKTRTEYVLCGSDFSQQEPRLLSYYSQDKEMMGSYIQGKDLYAVMAQAMYHNNYEDNLEFKNGELSPEGKKRRASAKPLLLGISYGMGVGSIAEMIGTTQEQAQKFLDDFFLKFHDVKKWMDDTVKEARKTGYVEDLFGRKRRLPEMKLPTYSFEALNNKSFNPFIECENTKSLDINKINKYKEMLTKCKFRKDIIAVSKKAEQEGILIKDNNKLIADAERQCVNARIQGGASSMTKVAMIKVYNDKEMQDMGFKLIIPVHDELIGEVPKYYSEKAGDRLAYLMKTCLQDKVNVPFKCDATIIKHWYEDELEADIHKYINEQLSKGVAKNIIYDNIKKEHSELDEEQITQFIGAMLN